MLHSAASRIAFGLTLLGLSGLGLAAQAGESSRFVVSDTHVRAVAYPARAEAANQAPIVYLHGICGAPDKGCDAFAADATRFGPFVCPRANVACDSGSSWGGTVFKKLDTVDRAMQLVADRTNGALDVGRPGILVGFSQGAYAAVELVKARPGRFRGMFLVGANVDLPPKQMLAIGVTRVVLAAGRYDGTAAFMRSVVRGLDGTALQARFVDLGPVGHTYVPTAEREAALHDAWSWLDEAEEVAD